MLNFEKFDNIIDEICAQIKKRVQLKTIDAIAFRGISGILVGMSVCAKLKKPPIVVRKKGEGSHPCRQTEGAIDAKKIIIVDDCVSSGDTVRSILDHTIESRGPFGDQELKCRAIFLYRNSISDNRSVKWQNKTITAYGTKKTKIILDAIPRPGKLAT